MVARTKQRWRERCATCGVEFERPQHWAYCSKACEAGRLGHAQRSGQETAEQVAAVDEYLSLSVQLEDAVGGDRITIAARLHELQDVMLQPEIVPVGDVTPSTPRRTSKVPKSEPEYWVPVLEVEWDRFRKSMASAIALGRRLNDAKAALEHGKFGQLFADHPHPIDGAMPFTASWARKLMAIASHEVLANRSHANDLPADLTVVYELSRVAPEKLERAIESGAVSPSMRRQDVRKFTAAAAESAHIRLTDELAVAKCMRSVRRAVDDLVADRPALLGDLVAQMGALVRELKRFGGGGA